MKHENIKKLIALYHDDELTPGEKEQVRVHIRECDECRREFEEMTDLEDVMNKMSLKPPPKEAWENYWNSIYNRMERQIGWIFLSIGAIIFLFYGGYRLIQSILRDPGLPLLVKIGILAVLGGLVILLVSLAREQIFVYKRERYKEVQK
jgi:predicted anti-sigma-YlaC factor YlaD